MTYVTEENALRTYHETSELKVSRPGNFTTGTGSPEAVTRLRFAQNGLPLSFSTHAANHHEVPLVLDAEAKPENRVPQEVEDAIVALAIVRCVWLRQDLEY